MNHVELSIPDMTCGSCLGHVRTIIATVPGTTFVSAHPLQRRVDVRVSSPAVLADLLGRLSEDGYPATPRQAD